MKLSLIFMNSFLIISLIVSVIFSGYSIYTYNNVLKENINNNLETIVDFEASHIGQYADLKKQRARDFSSDGFIKAQLIELYAGKDISEIDKILYYYIENKKMPLDKDIYEIYILDIKGDIVAEIGHEEEYEREEEEKSEFHEDPLYVKGKDNPYFTSILYDEEFEAKGFAVSAPILDEGKLLGVIILKISLNSLSEITTDRTGLGETGETYLVNEEKFLVTPSRFLRGEEKGVLVQKIDTEHSRACFNESIIGHSERDEPVTSFLNYHGEIAFGTHREIPETKWCLLVEINKSEVLDDPLRNYIIRQIIFGLIIILIFSLIGYFIGKYFDKKRGKK